MTPDAPPRPPDRVVYGEWEPDPDAPTPATRTVSWSLPWPFPRQYRDERAVYERRRVSEFWNGPQTIGRWDYERRERWVTR